MFVIAQVTTLAEFCNKNIKHEQDNTYCNWVFDSNTLTSTGKMDSKIEYLVQSDTILVFKPREYNQTEKFPLVYLLHGYSENYKQWSQTTDLQKLADYYGFIIVTPDGFTSYYINSPINNSSQYEDFFFKELVTKVHQSFQY